MDTLQRFWGVEKPGLRKHPFSFFNLLFAFKSDWKMMPSKSI